MASLQRQSRGKPRQKNCERKCDHFLSMCTGIEKCELAPKQQRIKHSDFRNFNVA